MNLNEFTDLNDYMDFLNNLCIYITFFYSIILILDELFNIGIFTYNYTYNYNYGTATQKFNGVNTIECETSRFKTYNNINFFKTDIFNNTYFNYLITVSITLITIISSISYGIYFYYTIIDTSAFCKYDISDELMSYPKKFLKCICNDCHKILPNCSINYLILFVIIIIIPIAYIIKLFLKYDFTPTSNLLFMIISIVLFSYIYNIYDNNQTKSSSEIIKEILIFFFFTIIFIISLLVHKNIYDTYNDSSLNTNLKDDYVMYDIYKQAPPNKPSPIPLPIFKGNNLLKTFKYIDGGDIKDTDYDNKKLIVDKYYSDKKDYEKAMIEYNIKNDSYNSMIEKQRLKLDDKTYYFDIMINMLGIKNHLNIMIIITIIILFVLYYYYDEELFLSGMIYLINVLILITLINAITFYNTYLNKYIIYEPSSYYKNDITIANTKLNMYFNSGNGDNFYHILNNNASINYNINDDFNRNNIINSIKTLTSMSNFNIDNIKLITNNINKYNDLNTQKKLEKKDVLDSIIYYNFALNEDTTDTVSTSRDASTLTNLIDAQNTAYENAIGDESNVHKCNLTTNQETYISSVQAVALARARIAIKNALQELFYQIDKIIIYKNNQIDNFKIITNLNLYFSSNSFQIMLNLSNYYAYLYYKLYFYKSSILNYLNSGNSNYKVEYLKLYNSLEKIILLLTPYKSNIILSECNNNTFIKPTSDEGKKYIFENNIIETAIKTKVDTFLYDDLSTKYDIILQNINTILFNYDSSKKYINSDILIINDHSTTANIISSSLTDDDKRTNDTNAAYIIPITDAIKNIINKSIYLSIDNSNNNSIASTIQDSFIQPFIKIGESNFYEFPNKIKDNNNNDIIISIKKTADLLKYEKIYYYINNKISDNDLNGNKYILKSTYNDDNNSNQFKLSKLIKYNIYTPKDGGNTPETTKITHESPLYLPTNIYKYNNDTSYLTFKKIIINVLYHNLVNITTQFDNNDLKNLFAEATIDNSKINLYNFTSLFTALPSEYDLKNLTGFIKGITSTTIINDFTALTPKNVLGFIILLYNIYNYDSNKLISIIEYLIYMQASNPLISSSPSTMFNDLSTIFSKTSPSLNNNDLVKDLNNIQSKIIKPKNEKDYIRNNYLNVDLIKYYEKNKYLLSLILNIYSNIFINIKSVISSIDKSNLCFSSNDKYVIEQNLYNHISKYYTLGTSLPLTTVNIKPAFFNKESKQKLLDINQEIINVFKIIDFIFDNLTSDSDTTSLSKEQDEIIKNYNFYNPELYNNIKNFTQEELFINCNYVNKYNNLETSKLELFKYNCDNVAYNFPILLIIFVVIFGEAYLIKY